MNDHLQPNDISQQQALWRSQLAERQAEAEADTALQSRLDAIRATALGAAMAKSQLPARRWLALAASLGAVAIALPLLINTAPESPAAFVAENYQQQSSDTDNPLALYGDLDHYQWFVLGE